MTEMHRKDRKEKHRKRHIEGNYSVCWERGRKEEEREGTSARDVQWMVAHINLIRSTKDPILPIEIVRMRT